MGAGVTVYYSFDDGSVARSLRVWIRSFNITLRSIVIAKRAVSRLDILVRPLIGQFGTMDFFKIQEVAMAKNTVRDQFKRQLDAVLCKT